MTQLSPLRPRTRTLSGYPGVGWVTRNQCWRAIGHRAGKVVHIRSSKFPEVCYLDWLDWMGRNNPEGLAAVKDLPPRPDMSWMVHPTPVTTSEEMQAVVRSGKLSDWCRARKFCGWRRQWIAP